MNTILTSSLLLLLVLSAGLILTWIVDDNDDFGGMA